MSTETVDDAVKALLKEHAYLQIVEVGEGEHKRVRVRCDLTQHEVLPRKDAIEAYLKTKKFVKARDWYCYDYSKYEPYIVVHRRKPKNLYCNVTGMILNRIPAEVEKHVNGKRFKRQKEHVKFEVRRDGEEGGEEFDANSFEFENQQLIYSDEEGDDGKADKKTVEEEDGDLAIAEEEDVESDEDADEDDVMADFYPDEDADEQEDDHIREAVARITKKRKNSSGDDNDGVNSSSDADGETEDEEPVPKAKKEHSKPKVDVKKHKPAKVSKHTEKQHHKSNGGVAKSKRVRKG